MVLITKDYVQHFIIKNGTEIKIDQKHEFLSDNLDSILDFIDRCMYESFCFIDGPQEVVEDLIYDVYEEELLDEHIKELMKDNNRPLELTIYSCLKNKGYCVSLTSNDNYTIIFRLIKL